MIFSLLLLSHASFGDRVNKALKLLNKGKYEKARVLIAKSLEKFPINAPANYALAMLFYDSTYHKHDLDSSHYFIELALVQEQTVPGHEMWPLEKSSLTLTQLLLLKHRVDSAAFGRAALQNTVEGLQYFIDNYSNALQNDEAVLLRDQLAFERAALENTYQSYKEFIDYYPQAAQLDEANNRYHLLLFQSMTKGGRLEDYRRFLEENPQSPYRSRAEQQVFQLTTLDNEPESYLNFLKVYPQSPYARQARGTLYHLNKEWAHDVQLRTDSLSNSYLLESSELFAIYQNGFYGFMDHFGMLRIPAVYDSIAEDLLCRQLTRDYFQSYRQGHWVMLGRNQQIIWNQPYDLAEDWGNGLIKVEYEGKAGLIHKGGWTVLPLEFEEVKLLPLGFIAFRKDGLWGLSSMTGRELLPAQNSDLIQENDYILLKKDAWAILNKSKLLEIYRDSQSPAYLFDDWELISPGHILAIQGDKEGIFNSALQPMVPLSKHHIYEVDSLSWCARTAHGTVRFYGHHLDGIPHDRYQNFLATDQFVCLQRALKWEIWDRNTLTAVNDIKYDSVARLGSQILVLMEGQKTTLLFSSGTMLPLKVRQAYKLMRGADQLQGFLQIYVPRGLRQIYDLSGQEIYRTSYYDLLPLTADLMIIEKNGKKGVVSLNGKILLKPEFETVVADGPDHLSILQNGRFGYYSITSNSLIKPQYQSRVLPFEHQLLLTSRNGNKGLIDIENRPVLPFEYQEIVAWSDNTVWVRRDGQWSLYNYVTKTTVLENVQQWQWINDQEPRTALFRKNGKYGLIGTGKGMFLEPVFKDIVNLGSAKQPLFLTENFNEQGNNYQVTYRNRDLKVIRKQQLDPQEYEKLLCF